MAVSNERLALAKACKDIREAKGWTQEKLAARAGPAQRTVSALENAENVTIANLDAICRALGSSMFAMMLPVDYRAQADLAEDVARLIDIFVSLPEAGRAQILRAIEAERLYQAASGTTADEKAPANKRPSFLSRIRKPRDEETA